MAGNGLNEMTQALREATRAARALTDFEKEAAKAAATTKQIGNVLETQEQKILRETRGATGDANRAGSYEVRSGAQYQKDLNMFGNNGEISGVVPPASNTRGGLSVSQPVASPAAGHTVPGAISQPVQVGVPAAPDRLQLTANFVGAMIAATQSPTNDNRAQAMQLATQLHDIGGPVTGQYNYTANGKRHQITFDANDVNRTPEGLANEASRVIGHSLSRRNQPFTSQGAGQTFTPAAAPAGVSITAEENQVRGLLDKIDLANASKDRDAGLKASVTDLVADITKGAKNGAYTFPKDVTVMGQNNVEVTLKRGVYAPHELANTLLDAMSADPKVKNAVNTALGQKTSEAPAAGTHVSTAPAVPVVAANPAVDYTTLSTKELNQHAQALLEEKLRLPTGQKPGTIVAGQSIDPAKLDGVVGEKTEASIKRVQAMMGQEQTGKVTHNLLAQLAKPEMVALLDSLLHPPTITQVASAPAAPAVGAAAAGAASDPLPLGGHSVAEITAAVVTNKPPVVPELFAAATFAPEAQQAAPTAAAQQIQQQREAPRAAAAPDVMAVYAPEGPQAGLPNLKLSSQQGMSA